MDTLRPEISIGTEPTLEFHDFEPSREEFLSEVLEGLGREGQKLLPCKYFYDRRGSQLFDEICELDEYYPTRTETSIMEEHGAAMAERLGPACLLVEYGSGSSVKTRILLDHLREPAGYVPIDISQKHLLATAESLARSYPELEVLPVCADYMAPIRLPGSTRPAKARVAYFPGSTIGNFHRPAAVEFLRRVAEIVGPGGGLLIGVDLKKDPARLEAAYNDARGVTAAFNLNILRRINDELSADFDLEAWEHRAPYNPRDGRIEMHLVSQRAQSVRLNGSSIAFGKGETIRTECSYKYGLDEFRALAADGGFDVEQVWTDAEPLFSVQFLRAVQ